MKGKFNNCCTVYSKFLTTLSARSISLFLRTVSEHEICLFSLQIFLKKLDDTQPAVEVFFHILACFFFFGKYHAFPLIVH